MSQQGNKKCDILNACKKPTKENAQETADATRYCYNILSKPQQVCKPGKCITNLEKQEEMKIGSDKWLRDYDKRKYSVTSVDWDYNYEPKYTCKKPYEISQYKQNILATSSKKLPVLINNDINMLKSEMEMKSKSEREQKRNELKLKKATKQATKLLAMLNNLKSGELNPADLAELLESDFGIKLVDFLQKLLEMEGGIEILLQLGVSDEKEALKILQSMGIEVDPNIIKILQSILSKGPSGIIMLMKAVGVCDKNSINSQGAVICKCCKCAPCKCSPKTQKFFAHLGISPSISDENINKDFQFSFDSLQPYTETLWKETRKITTISEREKFKEQDKDTFKVMEEQEEKIYKLPKYEYDLQQPFLDHEDSEEEIISHKTSEKSLEKALSTADITKQQDSFQPPSIKSLKESQPYTEFPVDNLNQKEVQPSLKVSIQPVKIPLKSKKQVIDLTQQKDIAEINVLPEETEDRTIQQTVKELPEEKSSVITSVRSRVVSEKSSQHGSESVRSRVVSGKSSQHGSESVRSKVVSGKSSQHGSESVRSKVVSEKSSQYGSQQTSKFSQKDTVSIEQIKDVVSKLKAKMSVLSQQKKHELIENMQDAEHMSKLSAKTSSLPSSEFPEAAPYLPELPQLIQETRKKSAAILAEKEKEKIKTQISLRPSIESEKESQKKVILFDVSENKDTDKLLMPEDHDSSQSLSVISEKDDFETETVSVTKKTIPSVKKSKKSVKSNISFPEKKPLTKKLTKPTKIVTQLKKPVKKSPIKAPTIIDMPLKDEEVKDEEVLLPTRNEETPLDFYNEFDQTDNENEEQAEDYNISEQSEYEETVTQVSDISSILSEETSEEKKSLQVSVSIKKSNEPINEIVTDNKELKPEEIIDIVPATKHFESVSILSESLHLDEMKELKLDSKKTSLKKADIDKVKETKSPDVELKSAQSEQTKIKPKPFSKKAKISSAKSSKTASAPLKEQSKQEEKKPQQDTILPVPSKKEPVPIKSDVLLNTSPLPQITTSSESFYSKQYSRYMAAKLLFRPDSCPCLPGFCTCPHGHYIFKPKYQTNFQDLEVDSKKVVLSDECICCKLCDYEEKKPPSLAQSESLQFVYNRPSSVLEKAPSSERMTDYERTVVIIKPEAMQFKDVILRAVKKAGMDLINERILHLTPEQVTEIYTEQALSPYFSFFVSRMSKAPIAILSIGGYDAVFRWNQMIGLENVLPAKWFFPASIKRRFQIKGPLRDLIYTSPNIQKAKLDNNYFFPYDILDPVIANLKVVRDYCDKYIAPTLVQGIYDILENRPENAVEYLAEYLLLKNPYQPKYPKNVALTFT